MNTGNIGHLGLVSNDKRNIRRGSQYERLFPLGSPSKSVTMGAENAHATRRAMIKIVHNSLDETVQIARHLQTGSLPSTLKNIYEFLYSHIKYANDSPGVEHLRSPLETWRDRKGDCDDYSIFISSVLVNLGIPHYMSMAKYGGKFNFQHIYIIVPKSGTKIRDRKDYYAVDPVVHEFDHEEPFSEKDDLLVPKKGLRGLQGLGTTSITSNMSGQEQKTIREWLFSTGIANMQNKNSGLMYWYGGYNSYLQREFPGGKGGEMPGLFYKSTGYDLNKAKSMFMQIAPEFFTSTGTDLNWTKVQRNDVAATSPTTATNLITQALVPQSNAIPQNPNPTAAGSNWLLLGGLGAVVLLLMNRKKKKPPDKPLAGVPKARKRRPTIKKAATMSM
jgi:hypothetical protein